MEYLRVVACPANSTANPTTDVCAIATQLCLNKPGTGVLTRLFQRPAGSSTPWEFLDQTCDPEAIAGPATPGLTLADIRREFAATPLATPTATTQPPDQRTLITLPVYFTAAWDTNGLRPGQTRTLSLLGHRVDLTIALRHYVYDFGDGTTTGPTTSPGGPYPTGDIHHPYPQPGTYQPTLTAVLTATYRIDGSPPHPIGDTATRQGTLPPLTVLTATNRLTG